MSKDKREDNYYIFSIKGIVSSLCVLLNNGRKKRKYEQMINKGKTPKRKPEPRNHRVASCSSSIKIRHATSNNNEILFYTKQTRKIIKV